MTIADQIALFNKGLDFNGSLPDSVQIMNPFKENPLILSITEKFYRKYYSDSKPRYLILGINPGRFGAGLTGIPFTDTIRLSAKCGISTTEIHSYEPSSEFIYEMIESYGGVKEFYAKYYINSVCPLGFTRISEKGNEVNCNYYDFKELTEAVYDFILTSIKTQISFGIKNEICYCLGNTDNYNFLAKLNKKEKLFNEIVPLEHPRYVMQYKRKDKQKYINKYIEALK